MPDPNGERPAENVAGRFHVSWNCLDCDLCRAMAPWHFRRSRRGESGRGGHSYVARQPATPSGEALCRLCLEACPHDAIRDDGGPATGPGGLGPPWEIVEGIRNFRWVGAWATSGQPTEKELEAVREAGGEVVINLALPTSDGALADERGVATRLGMEYLHLPVLFDAPSADDFRRFREAMDRFETRRVLIHCALNYRVSAFVFLHRVLAGGVTLEEAEVDLRAIWEPDPVWAKFIKDRLRDSPVRGVLQARPPSA